MGRYHHLGLDERRILYRLVQTGRSVKQAAMELGRHPSTLYREIKRNRHLDEEPLFRGYFPTVAQTKATGRRVRGAKVARHPELAIYIMDRLAAAWSPEQIAGYVRRHRLAGLSICHGRTINMSMAAKVATRDCGVSFLALADHDVGAMPASRAAFISRLPTRSRRGLRKSVAGPALGIGKAT